jgi:low affinity Fe/Cu permease
MPMSNKVYDILKWIAQIFLPAAITLFGTIGTAIGFSHTDVVITIAIAVDTFLGTILGISSNSYKKKEGVTNGEDDP